MRRFSANDGALWDAVIGHESWGTFVLIFTPVADGDARKVTMVEETALTAETELDAKSDDELRALLSQSSPW
ncbi:MAG TPA: hypothetical protein VH080_02050 [Gemmatimonadaceae bacterium]|jgi:hypothetical protein|nr:hypothetical protein [Gemmatimonadaceae bacterium]